MDMKRDRQEVWRNFGINFDGTWSIRFCCLGIEDDITENSLEQMVVDFSPKDRIFLCEKVEKRYFHAQVSFF